MNVDTIKALNEALSPLAQKLGEGTTALWQMYITQERIWGIVWTSAELGYLLILVLCVRLGIKHRNHIENLGLEIAVGVGGFFAAILLIIVLITLPDTIMHIFIPQFYALQDILNVVRGGTHG